MTQYTLHFKIPNRIPLPVHVRKPIPHLTHPSATLDNRLSGKRHLRTQTLQSKILTDYRKNPFIGDKPITKIQFWEAVQVSDGLFTFIEKNTDIA
ncbi:TPA: hypothetical protein ACU8BM_001895 [Neisseria subflava]